MNKYLKANNVFSKFSREFMELKKDYPLRPSEMEVINVITTNENNFTPLTIAEILGVSKPMITAHITSLEEKGYIFKEYTKFDKRSFYVRPTEKAKAFEIEFEIKQTKLLKQIEIMIGEEAFDNLIKTIEKTNRAMSMGQYDHEIY